MKMPNLISKKLSSVLALVLLNLTCVPAPFPRCSFLIRINKLAEYSNIMSDASPLFPVPPCEYGGPWQAMRAGDMKAVFLLADTEKVLRAVYYEGLWFLRKGAARLGRIMRGEEPFIHDDNILREGYKHYTPYVRTRQIATNNYRNPEIINNPKIYAKVIAENLRELRGNRNKNKGYRPKRKISASEGVFQVEEGESNEPNIDQPQGGYRLPVELSNYEISQHHQQQQQPQQFEQLLQPYYQQQQQQQQYQPQQFEQQLQGYLQEGQQQNHHQQQQSYQQQAVEPQQPVQIPQLLVHNFKSSQVQTERNLHGGFVPGFSSNDYEETSNEYYGGEDDSKSFNERSDDEILRPEPSSAEFRPHQKVYRTKTLENFEDSFTTFGTRISK